MPAIVPITIKIAPVTYPDKQNMYGRERIPPPMAAEHSEKILPLILPFSSLPNALSKNGLEDFPPGERGIRPGLILMSASAYLEVIGDTGDNIAF